MPRAKRDKGELRHAPLGETMEERTHVEPRRRPREKAGRRRDGDEPAELVDARLSGRVLAMAHAQQQEMEAAGAGAGAAAAAPDDEPDLDIPEDPESDGDEALIQFADGGEYVEEVEEITEADELALQQFMTAEAPTRRTLADVIMEKIREKEMEEAGLGAPRAPALNPKVTEAYAAVGRLLSHYSSGKLPKAFKIIPSLRNWEEVVFVTEPDKWSPQAMLAATRIFASNFNPRMAQRFYNIILLERVLDDIERHKRLNYHLYFALKKALYKPQAFYKGILLPLCESGHCTLRTATIVGSVIAKVSIPLMDSAAALHRLAEMPYSGANSLFMRVLLNKKYNLPHQVIDGLVAHFAAFVDEDRTMPVIWHRALLVLAQRYKQDITAAQKEALKPVMRKHFHHQITPEVRRELFSSVSRGEAAPEAVGESMEL